MRGAAPPRFPVSPRPRAPCLPGSKLQGSLLPGHQEGVGELCVSQLPHLLGIRGRGSDSRPRPQALWWGGRRIVPQGQFKQRDKDGELVQWLPIPSSPAKVPRAGLDLQRRWDLRLLELQQISLSGGGRGDSSRQRGHQDGNWLTRWVWERGFSKSRRRA